MLSIGSAVCFTSFMFGVALGGAELVLFFTVLRPQVLPLFRLTAEAARLCTVMVLSYALSMPLHGYTASMVIGVLRGGGDVKASLIIDNIPLWFFSLPIMCLLGLVLRVPNVWFCPCLMIEHIVKAPLGIWRVRSGKWVHDITRSE